MTGAPESEGNRIPAYWWNPHLNLDVETEGVGLLDLARASLEDVATLLAALRTAGKALENLAAIEIADAIGRVGERILGPERDRLAAAVAAEAGFSGEMSIRVVEGMARGWTRPALRRLLDVEFQDPAVLDGFTPHEGRTVWARGAGLTFHLGAGSVPGVTATSLIRALLVKCPSIVKPGAGDVTLSVEVLRLLWEEAPVVAAGGAVLYWEGGAARNQELERRVLGEVDQVVAYGGAGTVERVRAQTPIRAGVILHGPRTGVVVVRSDSDAETVAEAAALFDQRGCVSPHVALFLGSHEEARRWGEELEEELRALDRTIPCGTLPPEVMSRLHQIRGALDLRNAGGEGVATVGKHVMVAPLQDVEPLGGRTVWVVPCDGEPGVTACIEALGPVLQSVGIDDPGLRERLAPVAAAAGATRIVPVARLAFPPPEWVHDGRGPLRELVRWSELS